MNAHATRILCLLALLAGGCGRKGPLTLEPLPTPSAPQGLSVRQTGAAVRIEWTLPERLAEDRGEMDIKRLGRTTLYLADRSWPADRFREKASVLARLRPEELETVGTRSFAATRELKEKQLADRPLYFAVEYEWGRRRSPASAVVSLAARRPPPPVADLKGGLEGKLIVLRWSRPPQPAAATPRADVAAATGFDVYRRVVGEGGDRQPQRLTATPLADPYFVDRDLTRDGEYQYRVSVRVGPGVESAHSNLVSVAFRDTFAPDAPRNLVAFNGRDHVLISWEKVTDLDLAGYRVYRKGPLDADFRPLADGVGDNFYRDARVEKGKSYQYAVAALDRKGNESARSPAVAQKFE